jgi:hypothetical protein
MLTKGHDSETRHGAAFGYLLEGLGEVRGGVSQAIHHNLYKKLNQFTGLKRLPPKL